MMAEADVRGDCRGVVLLVGRWKKWEMPGQGRWPKGRPGVMVMRAKEGGGWMRPGVLTTYSNGCVELGTVVLPKLGEEMWMTTRFCMRGKRGRIW